MNCQEFENLLHFLVSDRLLDAVPRAKGLSHAESCSRCQIRLENERLLATGLRALARETREKQAPARIENALLEAFRGQKNSTNANAGLDISAHSIEGNLESLFSGPQTGRAHSRAWLIGAAASALLLAGLGFMHWRGWFIQPGNTQIPRVSIQENRAPSPSVGRVPGAPLTVAAPLAPFPKVEKGSHPRKVHNSSFQENVKRNLDSTSEEEIGRREIDTNFLPLMAASPLEPTESGHLIRMNLPRSTMGRFGFPINSERGEEPIKADVLIGEDGVARAIRFVYTAEEVPSSAR